MDGDLDDMSLSALFSSARAILKQLEELPASEAEQAAALFERGAAALRRAAALVESLGLFSPNEEQDDIATTDLKYLLLPFYQGQLSQHSRARDPLARAAALEAAARHYSAFLQCAKQYDLLGQEAAAMLEALEGHQHRDVGSRISSSRAGGVGSRGGRSGPDPAALRQQKIAKFKREKYLSARLAALQALRQQKDEAEDAPQKSGGDIEESERELWLLQLEQAALQAADCLAALQQEVQLLRHAASIPDSERQAAAAGGQREGQRSAQQQGAQQPPPPAMLAKLRQAVGTLQASSAAGRREQLRQQVLQPGHNLPTMTVEEWGAVEYRMAVERQQRDAAAQAQAAQQRGSADSEEEEEAALQKQRAWDDWLDDNPRGWGNSKLRPCG